MGLFHREARALSHLSNGSSLLLAPQFGQARNILSSAIGFLAFLQTVCITNSPHTRHRTENLRPYQRPYPKMDATTAYPSELRPMRNEATNPAVPTPTERYARVTFHRCRVASSQDSRTSVASVGPLATWSLRFTRRWRSGLSGQDARCSSSFRTADRTTTGDFGSCCADSATQSVARPSPQWKDDQCGGHLTSAARTSPANAPLRANDGASPGRWFAAQDGDHAARSRTNRCNVDRATPSDGQLPRPQRH